MGLIFEFELENFEEVRKRTHVDVSEKRDYMPFLLISFEVEVRNEICFLSREILNRGMKTIKILQTANRLT